MTRSRPRAYLALARVSNLPTVWTNVLAGMALAFIPFDWFDWLAFANAAIPLSAIYTGGMFLNDAFDRRHDAVHRPERPIPRGEVFAWEAFVIGVGLIAFGVVVLGFFGAAPWATALAISVVMYDWLHKNNPLAPALMGACRGLVYCCAAQATGALTPAVYVGAGVMAVYVTVVTLIAKYGGTGVDRWIARLIAGICIVDAVVIASQGRYALAGLAAAGFPLTLLAQRWVRGT